ncbi:MAG: hypothetical protein LC745_02770 [Planctomycetia bacterium]|nr:hypothetical protein [Planctomycetia bacterium]
MTPAPGTRMFGGPGSAYELVGPGWDDDRHSYLQARKLFRNFRYPAEALDETPADECLDVLIRVPIAGTEREGLSDAFERQTVPTRHGMTWFLDWLDLIEPPEGETGGPWLVFADPHPATPRDVALADPKTTIVLSCELLSMLDALHESGLVVGAMAPVDLLPCAPSRWYFLGTDKIHPATRPGDVRDDLTHWATLVSGLLGGGRDERGSIRWLSTDLIPPRLLDQSRWLFERVRLCLDGDPVERPGSVSDLQRRDSRGRGPLSTVRRLLGRRPGES